MHRLLMQNTVTSYNLHLATNFVFDVSVGGLNWSWKTFSDTDSVYKMLNWQIEKGTCRQIPETWEKIFMSNATACRLASFLNFIKLFQVVLT